MRCTLPPPSAPPPVMLHTSLQIDASTCLRSPGVVLRDDFMRPNGVSANELARRSGMPAWHIRRVLVGAPIHAEEALRLASALNTSALYWMVLQARHDLAKAQCAITHNGGADGALHETAPPQAKRASCPPSEQKLPETRPLNKQDTRFCR
ncbi:HigA family addiction module antitoxin [Dyella telluris]|uniref:HigA family addiction module antidote protein n=1 Tax=Dyella telluris TaxID=2763498 RepID=A0A7G8Q141_9GAMM|nr:HigA family addiction module antitoxin [Dyella telluris]QNK00499.1 HigA family addiction module antidote protein [Dyella telluris]